MTVRRPTAQSEGQMTVEELLDAIGALVTERQRLRRDHATQAVLEENRRAIASLQWDLSHALIERYLPQAA